MAHGLKDYGGERRSLASALGRPWSRDDSMRTLRRMIPDIVALDAKAFEATLNSIKVGGGLRTLYLVAYKELDNLRVPNISHDLVRQVVGKVGEVIVLRAFIMVRFKTRRSPGGEDDEEDLCSICLDALAGEARIATLDCRHEYHNHCITKWLLRGINVCPLCKQTALSC